MAQGIRPEMPDIVFKCMNLFLYPTDTINLDNLVSTLRRLKYQMSGFDYENPRLLFFGYPSNWKPAHYVAAVVNLHASKKIGSSLLSDMARQSIDKAFAGSHLSEQVLNKLNPYQRLTMFRLYAIFRAATTEATWPEICDVLYNVLEEVHLAKLLEMMKHDYGDLKIFLQLMEADSLGDTDHLTWLLIEKGYKYIAKGYERYTSGGNK